MWQHIESCYGRIQMISIPNKKDEQALIGVWGKPKSFFYIHYWLKEHLAWLVAALLVLETFSFGFRLGSAFRRWV